MSRRVCILRFDYFPQETHVRRNTAALLDAGYEVDLICLRGRDQGKTETVHGVRVHRVALERRRGNVVRYLFEYTAFLALSFFKVAQLHRSRRFDFVEVDSMPEALVFAAAPARWRGAKVALFIFDNMPEIFAYDFDVPMTHPVIRFMKWIERQSVRYADRVIVTHQDALEVLARHGVPRDHFDIVVNSPDESIFVLPSAVERDRDRFTLVSHGSQLRRYGYDTLVKAVAILGDHIPGLRVEMIGDGKHRSELMELAGKLGVSDRFDFVRWVEFEDIPSRIAAADAAVVPILLELALPNKLFEYSAVGVPVIISDLHTLRDYYGDDAVRYFPVADADALAEAILELYRSPERRRALADQARRLYRERYAWSRVKSDYLRVYEKLLFQTTSSKE
jgi:glycosyltransferase involved in cell wall biosynthesis